MEHLRKSNWNVEKNVLTQNNVHVLFSRPEAAKERIYEFEDKDII